MLSPSCHSLIPHPDYLEWLLAGFKYDAIESLSQGISGYVYTHKKDLFQNQSTRPTPVGFVGLFQRPEGSCLPFLNPA
jgi:hypothetical protein